MYKIDAILLNDTIISKNLYLYSHDTTVLLDAMGVPGDGNLHFDKILNYYIMIQSDVLQSAALEP
jgi:hypothetical protein